MARGGSSKNGGSGIICDFFIETFGPILKIIFQIILGVVVCYFGYRFYLTRKYEDVMDTLDSTYDKINGFISGESSSSALIPTVIASKPPTRPSSFFLKENKKLIETHFQGVERNINESARQYKTLGVINDVVDARLKIMKRTMLDIDRDATNPAWDSARVFINEYSVYSGHLKNATNQSKDTLRLWVKYKRDAKEKLKQLPNENEGQYGMRTFAFLYIMNSTWIEITDSYRLYIEKYEMVLEMGHELSAKNQLTSLDYQKYAHALKEGWSYKKIFLHYGVITALIYIPGAVGLGPVSPVSISIGALTWLWKALGQRKDKKVSTQQLEKVHTIQAWLQLVETLNMSHRTFIKGKLILARKIQECISGVIKEITVIIRDNTLPVNATALYNGFLLTLDTTIDNANIETMKLRDNTELMYKLLLIKNELELMDKNSTPEESEMIQKEIMKSHDLFGELDGDDLLEFEDNATTTKLPDRLHVVAELATGSFDYTS
jgi:hypothetical protein